MRPLCEWNLNQTVTTSIVLGFPPVWFMGVLCHPSSAEVQTNTHTCIGQLSPAGAIEIGAAFVEVL